MDGMFGMKFEDGQPMQVVVKRAEPGSGEVEWKGDGIPVFIWLLTLPQPSRGPSSWDWILFAISTATQSRRFSTSG